MSPLFAALLGALVISLISLIGILTLGFKDKVLKHTLLSLVSFSAGALLGGAFFHLLPEALQDFGEPMRIFQYTLIGFAAFFVIERILRWHHCHEVDCEIHPRHLGHLNLIGDSIHNLLDGIIIISAFTASPALGFPVLVSLALHEIPQEIGDYGVLIYAGFTKAKALLYNFISALAAIVGVVLGYFLINQISGLNSFLLPFAAGGFIYIASSDLIPELHKETNLKKSLFSFIVFILALVFMLLVAD